MRIKSSKRVEKDTTVDTAEFGLNIKDAIQKSIRYITLSHETLCQISLITFCIIYHEYRNKSEKLFVNGSL